MKRLFAVLCFCVSTLISTGSVKADFFSAHTTHHGHCYIPQIVCRPIFYPIYVLPSCQHSCHRCCPHQHHSRKPPCSAATLYSGNEGSIYINGERGLLNMSVSGHYFSHSIIRLDSHDHNYTHYRREVIQTSHPARYDEWAISKSGSCFGKHAIYYRWVVTNEPAAPWRLIQYANNNCVEQRDIPTKTGSTPGETNILLKKANSKVLANVMTLNSALACAPASITSPRTSEEASLLVAQPMELNLPSSMRSITRSRSLIQRSSDSIPVVKRQGIPVEPASASGWKVVSVK